MFAWEPRSLIRIVFFSVIAILLSGTALQSSDDDAVAAGATKTITRTATLSTTGQSQWQNGTGEGPEEFDIAWFDQTWDESDEAGTDIEEACIDFGDVLGEACFGEFGAEFSAATEGALGMSMTLKNFDAGSISVDYPVTVDFTVPEDNSFDPGDVIEIESELTVGSTASLSTVFPVLEDVGINGKIGFHVDVEGKVCFFGCFIDGNLIPEINAPDPYDGPVEGEIFSTGIDGTGCFLFPVNFALGLGTHPDSACTGNVGYVNKPNVVVTDTLNSDGTISAEGEDAFAIVPVSAVTWGGRLAGLGPVPLNFGPTAIPDTSVTVGWTTMNLIFTALEKMQQEITLDPRVDVTLDWVVSMPYEVVDPANANAVFSSGTGTTATYPAGYTVRLTTPSDPSAIINVTPTIVMGQATVTNKIDTETSGEGQFKMLSFTLATPSARECLGVGELEVCITFWPGTNWALGPLVDVPFAIESRVDNVWNASFQLGGFSSPEVDAFNIVPRPIVEVINIFVPANSPALVNLLIDDVQEATDVGNLGTTGRHILEPGTHKIHETAGTGSTLDQFVESISCVDLEGDEIASSDSSVLTDLVLTGGEDVVCTITNRLPIMDECLDILYDNFFLMDDGDNVVVGTPGRDLIIGYGGKDTLTGGNGDDCIAGGPGDDIIKGIRGNDIIAGDAGEDTIDGGIGNNVIRGGADDDTIDSGTGNDTVYGEGGKDKLISGSGADIVYGGDDADDINSGNENDEVYGGDGADTINAGNGNDRVFGGTGNDTIQGSNGNDYIDGEGDSDIVNGGPNTDTCIAERKSLCER